LFQPGRDDGLAFRFGHDLGVGALVYLALSLWPLGDVERAIFLIDSAQGRMASVVPVGTRTYGKSHAAMFELMRGDHSRAAQNAVELGRLAREYDLNRWRAYVMFFEGWANAPAGGLEEMRRGAELLRERKVLYFDGLLKIALAEAEAAAGDLDRALAILDEGLTSADRLGHRTFEAELHRARGEALLKRDFANPAPAEEAFLTAIAVAKQQGTRSFELRAVLSLANLYQSTSRLVDAHAVLAPALEGFPPTPEMPELSEAQALLAALAEMEQVKSAEGQRQRRLHLQTAYGQAMIMAKGFAAEETKTAFAHASELAAKVDDFAERFAACHGQWTLALVRGEQRRVRELAFPFLKEAEDAVRLVEVGVARRGLALSCLFTGDFLEARTHCERALEVCDPQRDRETRERFSDDTGTLAMSCLAVTSWQLGEVDLARELIDEANRRGTELGHAPSMAHPLAWKSELELFRGDAAAALSAAEALNALSREHGMPFWGLRAKLVMGWARGRLFDAAAGAEELRRVLALSADHGAISDLWFHTVLLAELEAETLGMDVALTHIDEALALADRVEYRCNLALAHRLRGELLLKRDPSNPAPAEEAFQRAIAVAKKQEARSWGLRAALSLARLYQSSGRPADAHAVLAPALKGFAPTAEMPEIAEAQALLVAIEAGAHVRHE
jgi:predicted ATPase